MILSCKITKNLQTAQGATAFFLNKDFNRRDFLFFAIFEGMKRWLPITLAVGMAMKKSKAQPAERLTEKVAFAT